MTGVVAVGILTAGVLAAIFGVIPFAQDKGAEQDLDSFMTAQGVSKAKDGRFNTSEVLGDKGYLAGPGNAAATVDDSGSCYVAVARSGSGKTYLTSNRTPRPAQLNDIPEGTCVPVDQIKQLVEKIGGTWPSGGLQLILAGANISAVGAGYMNAELAYFSSPAMLAYLSGDESATDAVMVAMQTYLDARLPLQQNIEESWDRTDLLNRQDAGLPALKQAYDAAINEFMSNPTAATQDAAVSALRAWYNEAGAAPHQDVVRLAGATYTSIPVTDPDLAEMTAFANTELTFESSQLELYYAWTGSTGDRYDSFDMQEARNLTAAGQAWNEVKHQDQMYGRIAASYRTDAGIPELRQTLETAESAYRQASASGVASVEQIAAYQQDYIDALRAFYAVTSSTPCPAEGCPTGTVY